jgi:hypothetical protein
MKGIEKSRKIRKTLAKPVPLVDRKGFEAIVGNLLTQAPIKRSEAKTGTRKRTGKVIPPKA